MTKWSTNESNYCKTYNWRTTGRNAASVLLPLLGSRGLILHDTESPYHRIMFIELCYLFLRATVLNNDQSNGANIGKLEEN